ncbi:MAG: hypothetical protein IKI52_07130, partial [Clostridia bacterium]|nr:hypothetical protein [Clostridia bacterium]
RNFFSAPISCVSSGPDIAISSRTSPILLLLPSLVNPLFTPFSQYILVDNKIRELMLPNVFFMLQAIQTPQGGFFFGRSFRLTPHPSGFACHLLLKEKAFGCV